MKKDRILIVDDDIDLLSLIDWNLNKLGYKTGVALNGLDGVKRIREFNPDLLILDLMMPEMDGLKLCRWLKNNSDAVISHLHVIIISALSSTTDRATALSAGADDYITKPFEMMELVLSIKNLLDKKYRNQILTCLS